MKRHLSVFIAAILAFGMLTMPSPVSAAGAASYIYTPDVDPLIPPSRNFSVISDKFTLDGKEIAVSSMFRYEFILMPAYIATNSAYAWEWFELQTPKPLSDKITSKHSVYRFGAAEGDVVYLREKDTDDTKAGNQPGNWRAVKIISSMFALTSGSGHVVSMDKPTEFTVKAENPYTSYEYAISVTNSTSPNLDWTPLGTSGADLQITGHTMPHSVGFTVLVRVAGSSTSVNQCVGKVYSKAYLDIRNEILALGSINKLQDTVYHVTVKGKKTIYSVAPGTDTYIPLSKAIGSSAVEVSVLYQLPMEVTANSSKAAKDNPVSTTPVLSETIKPRPVIGGDISQQVFISNTNSANWTLSGEASTSFEYTVAKSSMQYKLFDRTAGLPLLTSADQAAKKKAVSYIFRLAPDEQTMTPASKTKKFTQPKQVKAPTLKPDYKKETIKLKSGMCYYIGPADTDLTKVTFLEVVNPLVSITEALDNSYMIFIYQAESGNKSRSATQRIILAERFTAVDSGQGGLEIIKGKVKLQKGFEAFNEQKNKWGTLPAGVTTVLVRAKATGKYNAKTAVNTGSAASPPVLFALSYEGKTAVMATCRAKAPSGLTGLSLKIISGAEGFDNPFSLERKDYILGLKQGAQAANFTLQAAGTRIQCALTGSGTVKWTTYGLITVTGAKAGDVLRIVCEPANRHEQKTDVYTITMGKPFAPAPVSIAFSEETGKKGQITVTFSPDNAPSAGSVIQYDLYAMEDNDPEKEEWIFRGTHTVADDEAGNTEFTFDLAEEILKYDRGRDLVVYRAAARVLADSTQSLSGEISTGNAKSPNLFVTQKTLSIAIVNMFGPLGKSVPLYAPEILDVLNVFALDDLGNIISIDRAEIDWFRCSSVWESGTPTGKTGDTYLLGDDDVGFYISATVTLNGSTNTFITIGKVAGSGANLLTIEVQNGVPRSTFAAAAGFTVFDDAHYECAEITVDGLLRNGGALNLFKAVNSQSADMYYAFADSKLDAEPQWQTWTNGAVHVNEKYLYVKLQSGNAVKYYSFYFNVLPRPLIAMSADPEEVHAALNEIFTITFRIEGRNGVPIWKTEGSAGLIAVAHIGDDSIISIGEAEIAGDYISIKIIAAGLGATKLTLYIYPTAEYYTAYDEASFNGVWINQKSANLAVTIYITELGN